MNYIQTNTYFTIESDASHVNITSERPKIVQISGIIQKQK